jgi:uncharacterized protein YbcV (DUF1398 family)
MDANKAALAKRCIRGAETNTMTFPQIVDELIQGGFESYMIDLRRGTATYYQTDGDSVELAFHAPERTVVSLFDSRAIQAAVKDAQRQAPGYTYIGFCNKVAQAGCASYFVSFPGKRVLYIGRSGEVHVEHMP